MGTTFKGICTRPVTIELAALAVAAVIIGCQLFVPPILGIADQGDFARIAGTVGLDHASTTYEDQYFNYVDMYIAAPVTNAEWISSAVLFAIVAKVINRFVSNDGLFHIQALGFVYALFFLATTWFVLIQTRQWKLWQRLLFTALFVFMFTDIGYVAYFNSFFCEPACLIFFLMVAALSTGIATSRSRWQTFAYLIASALLVGTKPQYSVLGIPLVAFWVLLVRKDKLWGWRSVALAVVVLIAFSGWCYSRIPRMQRELASFMVVFDVILPNSDSPVEDLVDLGLDPTLIQYKGANPYAPDSPVLKPEFRDAFFSKISLSHTLSFYARHPRAFGALWKRASRAAFVNRPDFGNYEKSAGYPPRAQSSGYSFWDRIRNHLPKSLWFIIVFFGLNAVGLMRFRGRLSTVHALVMTIGVVSFITPVLGEGDIDLARHLFLFDAAFDVCLIADVLCVVGVLVNKYGPSSQPMTLSAT